MSNVLDEIVAETESASDAATTRFDWRRALLLAIDVGTSGVRAALFDEQAHEISGTAVRTDYQNNSYATFDADVLLETVELTLDKFFANFQHPLARIGLIAVSCFWHSMLGTGEEGKPTTPVLGWADPSAGKAVELLRAQFDETKVHARTGCRFHASYWPAKLKRLQDEEPEIFKRTRHWWSFSDYLALKFFGLTLANLSMVSGTGLFDQRLELWDEELQLTVAPSLSTLPETQTLNRPSFTIPSLKREYQARWPMLAEAQMFPAFADGAANSIGSGCHSNDKVALMIGTSGAMRVCFKGEPPQDLPFGLWCYRANNERVLIGGALSDGGNLIQWLRGCLFPDEATGNLESELEKLDPDSHGLTVMPFWFGERSTNWNPKAYGTIIGLSAQTQPIEILRAAMEGIAYRFAATWKLLAEFAPNATLVASGNALRASPCWMQMLADVLGRPVALSGTPEASTRGAALLALEATGKIRSIEDFSGTTDAVFEPNMQHHWVYQAALERQEKIYKQLFS
jgi:gluconokinase